MQILILRGLTEAHQNHEEKLYENRAKFVLHEHGQLSVPIVNGTTPVIHVLTNPDGTKQVR